MGPTIPSDTLFSQIMNGFFGNLNLNQQNTIWQAFLQDNGLTTNPSDSNQQVVTEFVAFIQTTNAVAQAEALSPDEVANRNIVFSIYQLILQLLNTVSANVSVLGKNLIYLANYQEQYNEQMARTAGAFVLQSPTATSTPTVNTTDLSKWTLGYGGITMQDYLSGAIVNGETASQSPPLTLSSLPVSVTANDPNLNLTLILQGAGGPSTTVPLNPIALTTLGINSDQLNAFSFQTAVSATHQLTVTVNFQVTNSTTSAPVTASFSFTDPLTVSNDQLTQDVQNGILSLLGKPAGTTGLTVQQVLQNPSTYTVPSTAPASDSTETVSSNSVTTNLDNSFTFNATPTSTTITFDVQTVVNGTIESIPVSTVATYNQSDTFQQKLQAVTAAFLALYGMQVGTTGQTVSDFVNSTTQPIEIPWYNSVSNPNLSILTPFTGNEAAGSSSAATDSSISQERATKNALLQQFIQNEKSRSDVISNQLDTQRARYTQSQQEISATTNILQSIIQSLNTVLSAIYT